VDVPKKEGKVVVDVTVENREALDARRVDTVAITLFGIESRFEKGKRVGSWAEGFGYATRHGQSFSLLCSIRAGREADENVVRNRQDQSHRSKIWCQALATRARASDEGSGRRPQRVW
jgi:hypothetical protein